MEVETLSEEPTPLGWLNIVHPDDAKKSTHIKTIRSHVTRAQHRASHTSSAKSTRKRDRMLRPATVSPGTPIGSEHSFKQGPTSPDMLKEVKSFDYASQQDSLLTGQTTTSLFAGSVPYQTFFLHDSDSTFKNNLSNLGYDISTLMSYYRQLCCVQADDLKSQFKRPAKSRNTGDAYLSFVHQDPILLSVVLLNTTRQLIHDSDISLSGKPLVSVLNLKGYVLRRLNEALRHPKRMSDQLLIAVSLCACHEAKHGSLDQYHVHMRGLVQMLSMLGGIGTVTKRSTYHNLEQLLLWCDANSAAVVGGKRYLQSSSDASKEQHGLQANPEVFRKKLRSDGG